MKTFSIGEIEIGGLGQALVVPEMGINHEGSLQVAKKIVDSAYSAGARLIKHQTHVVDDEMCHVAKNVIPGNSKDSIYEIMSRCALSESDEYDLMQYVQSKGMVYLSTPFSRAAANRLESFGVLAYKIGSGELNNYPLIKHIAKFGKPVILSTGMNSIEQIKKATNILEEYHVPFALLHTTNLYPTKPNQVRLGAMQNMMEAFPDIPVGLSDHTLNNTSCIAALALGASVVERHYIDDKKRPGPDVICSMDANGLRELLVAAHDIPLMRGGEKAPLPEEKVTIDFAFATCVSVKQIKKGETFSHDNLWVKRPGTGEILAKDYDSIIGKVALCDIDYDTQISWRMVEK